MMGIIDPPDATEIKRRAEAATDAIMTLHPHR